MESCYTAFGELEMAAVCFQQKSGFSQDGKRGWGERWFSGVQPKKKCGRIGAWVSNHRKGWLGPWGTKREVRLRGMIGGSSPPGVWENPVLFSGSNLGSVLLDPK